LGSPWSTTLEAYGDGQTSYAAYKKLEQCRQQGNEKVFEFKIHLEELFWTLEDEPSELAKTAKFMSGLLPSFNRKLCGREYSSLAHEVEAVQIEERRLGEAERRTHGEDWEQHGRGRERSREQSWTKWQAEKEQCGPPCRTTSTLSHVKPLALSPLQGFPALSLWLSLFLLATLVLQNCRELREFLKQANHYRRFVKDHAAVIKPLTVLTSPKVKWAWNDAQQQAFDDTTRNHVQPILPCRSRHA